MCDFQHMLGHDFCEKSHFLVLPMQAKIFLQIWDHELYGFIYMGEFMLSCKDINRVLKNI